MSTDAPAALRLRVMTAGGGPCIVARIGGRSAVYGLGRDFVLGAVEVVQRFQRPTAAGTTGVAVLSIPAEDGLYQTRGWRSDGSEERRFWQVTDGQAVEVERSDASQMIDAMDRERWAQEDARRRDA